MALDTAYAVVPGRPPGRVDRPLPASRPPLRLSQAAAGQCAALGRRLRRRRPRAAALPREATSDGERSLRLEVGVGRADDVVVGALPRRHPAQDAAVELAM